VTRVTTLGQMTASIAHEINQPLAAIGTNANASLRWLASDSPNLGAIKPYAPAAFEVAAQTCLSLV